MNDTLYNDQLSIFVYLQYQVNTSLTTYISDLNSLTQKSHFDKILKIDNQIKLIWILLVNENLNENLCYMKIIL